MPACSTDSWPKRADGAGGRPLAPLGQARGQPPAGPRRNSSCWRGWRRSPSISRVRSPSWENSTARLAASQLRPAAPDAHHRNRVEPRLVGPPQHQLAAQLAQGLDRRSWARRPPLSSGETPWSPTGQHRVGRTDGPAPVQRQAWVTRPRTTAASSEGNAIRHARHYPAHRVGGQHAAGDESSPTGGATPGACPRDSCSCPCFMLRLLRRWGRSTVDPARTGAPSAAARSSVPLDAYPGVPGPGLPPRHWRPPMTIASAEVAQQPWPGPSWAPPQPTAGSRCPCGGALQTAPGEVGQRKARRPASVRFARSRARLVAPCLELAAQLVGVGVEPQRRLASLLGAQLLIGVEVARASALRSRRQSAVRRRPR